MLFPAVSNDAFLDELCHSVGEQLGVDREVFHTFLEDGFGDRFGDFADAVLQCRSRLAAGAVANIEGGDNFADASGDAIGLGYRAGREWIVDIEEIVNHALGNVVPRTKGIFALHSAITIPPFLWQVKIASSTPSTVVPRL